MNCLLRRLILVSLLIAMPPLLHAADRPNLLLVVADDMGFSDLGSFGGEIDTPNLDRLANEGLRLTNFYAAATCSPTRAMLLTGVDHHLAGLGSMAERIADNQRGQPGYEGYLNERVVSVATRLRDSGYRTYMAGKWHLGKTPELSPAARGFERSFALLEGGGNHFSDVGLFPHSPRAHYREGKESVNLPEGFYSSRFYTDRMLQYLQESGEAEKPFFAYLAYTAPHWPLQAPKDLIEKYRGRYDAGYDTLRRQRIANLEGRGLIPKGLEQRLDDVPDYRPWSRLSDDERRRQARTMETYAAMIDDMDRQFGRVLDYLARTGELDNTVVVFLSDNGAEGMDLEKGYASLADWIAQQFDNSLDNLGSENSYIYQGAGWATAVMAPFYQMKRSAAEGGIRVPAFVWYPGFKRQSGVSDALITVKDIAPTLLRLANVDYSGDHFEGRPVEAVSGRPLTAFLDGKAARVHNEEEVLAWELFGHRAVRRGPWKLLSLQAPYGDGVWRLYNLKTDPSERHDLASAQPDKVRLLKSDWDAYAKANQVVMPAGKP